MSPCGRQALLLASLLAFGVLAGCAGPDDETGDGSPSSGGHSGVSGSSGNPSTGGITSTAGGGNSGTAAGGAGSGNGGNSAVGGGGSSGAPATGGVAGSDGNGGVSGLGGEGGGNDGEGGSSGMPIVDGWTTFVRPAGKKAIYVSDSQGDDDNDGRSESTPVKSIDHARSLLQPGDWMLLRRGDTFASGLDGWTVSGESEAAPTLIGAYGDEADPRPIYTGRAEAHAGATDGAPLEHLAFVGIHFLQRQRDPSSPDFDPAEGRANLSFVLPVHDLLFEDVRIEYGASGMNVIVPDAEAVSNVRIRRSVIRYNWNDEAHSQGVFFDKVNGLLIEESVIDHNGHHPHPDHGTPTIFNHNIYVQSNCRNVVLRRNIIARGSSHGFQLRPYGVAEGNLLVGNAIAGFVAGDGVVTGDELQKLLDNVVLHGSRHVLGEGGDSGARGWGLSMFAGLGSLGSEAEVRGNIVAFAEEGSNQALEIEDPALVDDNIVYQWGDESDPGTFPDPRGIPEYMESLGQTPTVEAFLERAAEQRRGAYFAEYTADQVNAFVRAGFR